MNLPMQNFDACVFSKQPGYHEPTVRKAFAKAVPLRTVVIYCYDPRAVGIPAAVASSARSTPATSSPTRRQTRSPRPRRFSRLSSLAAER